jgi:hypothetical protein
MPYKERVQKMGMKAIEQDGKGVYGVEVQHDTWCNIFKQGECNCEPTITMKKIKCD